MADHLANTSSEGSVRTGSRSLAERIAALEQDVEERAMERKKERKLREEYRKKLREDNANYREQQSRKLDDLERRVTAIEKELVMWRPLVQHETLADAGNIAFDVALLRRTGIPDKHKNTFRHLYGIEFAQYDHTCYTLSSDLNKRATVVAALDGGRIGNPEGRLFVEHIDNMVRLYLSGRLAPTNREVMKAAAKEKFEALRL